MWHKITLMWLIHIFHFWNLFMFLLYLIIKKITHQLPKIQGMIWREWINKNKNGLNVCDHETYGLMHCSRQNISVMCFLKEEKKEKTPIFYYYLVQCKYIYHFGLICPQIHRIFWYNVFLWEIFFIILAFWPHSSIICRKAF